ncbi:hypothetical protein DO97_07730 [Neosynechococcus sphagnicola sy1]|uniref:Uncharacterized protein n=1 Tax=Neosynechococcus sphagnicola sy1 TaxID=1497020 RepID=A0A098TL35_9CYAN|nr:hypothetical protein DO97_07730 [Neosynechococcus sphagnicola sy1]
MTPENPDVNQRSGTASIYRFLRGAALAAFVILIPISAGSSMDFNLVQVSFASLLAISCGLLSSLWGDKFIDRVTRVLNSFAL